MDKVPDSMERRKFVLAAYNAGLGHVFDAIRLAEKYEKDPSIWSGNVESMILNKSKPEFYKDSLAFYGYCRGSETAAYVKEIMDRYNHYRNITPTSEVEL